MSDARPVTHGERVARIATDSFIVTRAHYAPGLRVAWHEHERPGFTFLASGSVRETFASRAFECAADALILKPPDARHADVYGARGASCVIVELRAGRETWIREQTDLFERLGVVRAPLARRLLRESSPLAIEATVLDLLAGSATRSKAPAWLDRAREFLHAEFRSVRRVAEIAAVAGVHPVHLARTFRERYGCSVAAYLRRLRLEWAANALRDDSQSIAEIAASAGYADQSHFTRAFVARYGVPPARYRARCE